MDKDFAGHRHSVKHLWYEFELSVFKEVTIPSGIKVI